MKTKTKNSSRGVLAVSIIIAIVLWTLQQALIAVPSNVQASNGGESYSDFSQKSDNRQQQMVSLRDAMMESITEKIDTLIFSLSSYYWNGQNWNGQNKPGEEGSSWSQETVTTTSGWTLATTAVCIPNKVSDINNDKYQESIEWALDHCLVQWYEDGKFHTDKNINHNEMLIIAQRAWYRVDLAQWSEQVVTRSELLRFIDYLQASKQIALIPWIEFNTIIRRWEYINFLYAIDNGKVQAISEKNSIEHKDTNNEQWTPTKDKTSANMTIAEFKSLLNKSLAIPLPIEEYDNKIIVTEEVMKIILEKSMKQDDITIVKEEGSELWKEAVKTLLNWFMEKL